MNTSYEPFHIEVDPADSEFEEKVLTEVTPYADGTGWTVVGGGWSLGVPKLTHARYGGDPTWTSPEPKVGDTMRTYGSFGRLVRGIVLNGAVVFYRSLALQEQARRRMLEDMDAAAARQEVVTRDQRAADYAQLIPLFRARIDRLRAARPDFVRDEAYEIFILLQAQAVMDHYRGKANGSDDTFALALLNASRHPEGVDDFTAFNDLWGRLEKLGVLSKAHSNNTAGASLSFAAAVLAGRTDL